MLWFSRPFTNAKIIPTNKPILIFFCSYFFFSVRWLQTKLVEVEQWELQPGVLFSSIFLAIFAKHFIAFIMRTLKNIKVCNHVKNHCQFVRRPLWTELFGSYRRSMIRVHFRFVIKCIMQFWLRPPIVGHLRIWIDGSRQYLKITLEGLGQCNLCRKIIEQESIESVT